MAAEAVAEPDGPRMIHHSGKNPRYGARGSTVLSAALDNEFSFSVTRGVIQLAVTKRREGQIGGRHFFRLESVELGEDSDGDPVTSAKLVTADEPSEGAETKYSESELCLLRCFDAFLTSGFTKQDQAGGVDRAKFLQFARDRFEGPSSDAKRMTASRALAGLVKRGELIERAGRIFRRAEE